MLHALLLLFAPIPGWDRINQAARSVGYVLLVYLLPLVALATAAEGYGLVRWGKWRGVIPHLKQFTAGEVVIFEAGQFLLSMAIILLSARLIKAVGETFHGRHTYRQAFGAVAYGMFPFFLFRFLDAFPSFSPWLTWAAGILLSVGLLYQGLPRMMQPDPPHAFGLYLMSSLLLILITGLARFVTAWYLAGKLVRLENFISSIAPKWPS